MVSMVVSREAGPALRDPAGVAVDGLEPGRRISVRETHPTAMARNCLLELSHSAPKPVPGGASDWRC